MHLVAAVGRLAEALYVPRGSGAAEAEVRNRWETPDGLVLEELWLRGGPNERVPGVIAFLRERPGRTHR